MCLCVWFRFLSEEQLSSECGITNSIHRYRILDAIRGNYNTIPWYSTDRGRTIIPRTSVLILLDVCRHGDVYGNVVVRRKHEEELGRVHQLQTFDWISISQVMTVAATDRPNCYTVVTAIRSRCRIVMLTRRICAGFSLLKVHLQLRGYSVFIDVERLEAGKFDNNLLQSIKQAKTFLLVLTPKALDRCVGDNECKDWVHKVHYRTYFVV